jgi:hypothetical protein
MHVSCNTLFTHTQAHIDLGFRGKGLRFQGVGFAYRVKVVKHGSPLHLLEGHELRLEVRGRFLRDNIQKAIK